MSVRIGNTIVAGMSGKSLRGIGDIFTTIDTGVIAGAVEANGGSYNLADYNSGKDSVASKLAAGTLSYVSKAEFQAQVANTGACDSFGWNGASDTTFLVPKLNPWHVGKTAPVVGNGVTLGLTNGTTNYGLGKTLAGNIGILTGGTNWFDKSTGTSSAPGTTPQNNISIGVSTDPVKSGMIAELSETTNLRVMVQLATGATDQALEACTQVLSDVSALNAHRVIEFQAPTAANGYTWYRKYADGWVEQGGINNTDTLTYVRPMADTNYIMFLQPKNTSGLYAMNCEHLTTTGAKIRSTAPQWHNYSWQVSGMAA